MKGMLMWMVVVGVVAMLAFSGGVVQAKEMSMGLMTCQEQFTSLDSSGKGYINFGEFRTGYGGEFGSPIRSSNHKGVLNSSSAFSVFTAANTSRDGMLTEDQYCAWKNR